MLRRPYWSRLELVYLPEPSPLQFVYATVGLALVLLPLRISVRTSLAVRGTGDRP
jgi:hypothetical protein